MKQPVGSIIQMAFVVRDMRRSAEAFGKARGAGPFFLLEHVPLANPNYRGRALAPDFSVAIGFSGAMQIELIEQHCDTPSISKEFLDTHGQGYHHVWRRVADFKSRVRSDGLGSGMAGRQHRHRTLCLLRYPRPGRALHRDHGDVGRTAKKLGRNGTHQRCLGRSRFFPLRGGVLNDIHHQRIN